METLRGMGGGIFCEIVFTVLAGHAAGVYPPAATKPNDFVGACRRLEQDTHVPRSFQILIPRLLPAIYEVRNNRGVGHAGGDVDSNYMDAAFVVTSCSWIMGELVRVFHNVSIEEAQSLVDSLAQRRIPLVWEGNGIRRVLQPDLNLQSQMLVLLDTTAGRVQTSDLMRWIDYRNSSYFRVLLRRMHSQRLVELYDDDKSVEILPPGSNEAAEIIKSNTPNL